MNEYEKWEKELLALNERINNLKVWDDYAERLQHRYDQLLEEDPRKKGEKDGKN